MVELRKVESTDLDILFKWRNNKRIISLSASQKEVTFIEHKKWFNNIIASPTTIIFIILNHQKPIGQIRFNKIKDKETSCKISIYLIPGQENKGIGSKAINQGINKISQLWNINQIDAWIREDNNQSQLFFKKNNFVKENKNEGLIRYVYYTYTNINESINKNILFYDEKVSKFGISYKSLDWGSKKSQNLRFKVLSSIGDFSNKKILDFGCGIGDFYSWLIENNFIIDYTGIDISPKMILKAKERFSNVEFKQQDVFSNPLNKTYDYIFLSGVFTKTNEFFFQKCITYLFDNCTHGIGFNLLSKWHSNESKSKKYEFVASPIKTLSFCEGLTKKVVFRHDYHYRDFTIFLYK